MWALAHPLRFRILELLREGPSTASRLARRLGESRGSMSYHLRYLARAGTVEDMPAEGTGRERWWRRPEPLLLLPSGGDLEAQAIDQRMLAVFFARDDDVRRRFVTGEPAAAWRRAAFVGNWFVALAPQEADELAMRLLAVVEEYRSRTPPAGAEQALISLSVLPVLE